MTDRPIIFSGPMVRALAAGIKTQTRRILSPQPETFLVGGRACDVLAVHVDGEAAPRVATGQCLTRQKLRYAKGDRLYVREAYLVSGVFTDVVEVRYQAHERASYTEFVEQIPIDRTTGAKVTFPRYRPSIHMPRWASRLTLIVEDVRVERLGTISREDAIAEGIQRVGGGMLRWENWSGAEGQSGTSPQAAYALLWNRLHAAPHDWDADPFVVALTFRVEHGNIYRLARAE